MFRIALIIVFSMVITLGHTMNAKEKHIFGYVERVYLPELKSSVKAKLDTGAKSSSLSAVNIKKIKEGETTYLVFTIPLKSGPITLKKPLVGKVGIKSRFRENMNDEGFPKPLHRPIITLVIQIGKDSKEIEVNLTNRKRFNYPLLIGRDALVQFGCVIDPAESFLVAIKE